LEFALAIVSALSIILTIFYYNRDGFLYLSKKKSLVSLAFVFVGILLIMLKRPSIEGLFTIIVKQGIAEELIFRLGMLGILRIHLKFETIIQKETWAVLLLNSGLFSLLHHNIFLSLFVLSLIYGYLFLKFGIVSSIVSHVLWNFYLNLEVLVIVVIMIVSYESFNRFRRRKRPFFRWYKRKFDAFED
jgi:hypothetical protein